MLFNSVLIEQNNPRPPFLFSHQKQNESPFLAEILLLLNYLCTKSDIFIILLYFKQVKSDNEAFSRLWPQSSKVRPGYKINESYFFFCFWQKWNNVYMIGDMIEETNSISGFRLKECFRNICLFKRNILKFRRPLFNVCVVWT